MGHITHVDTLDKQAAVSAFLSAYRKVGRDCIALPDSPFFMNSKQLQI
jgi:hypothetical protein